MRNEIVDVFKQAKTKSSSTNIPNVKQNIQLNFIDESNRSWLVY